MDKRDAWDFPGSPGLRLWAYKAGGVGSTPDQGTKILHALWHSQKLKKIFLSKRGSVFFQ